MTEENIVGIIQNVQSGLLGSKAYNLIVTDKGIIVAQLTNKMLKEEAKKTAQSSKEQGEGFLKRIGNQMDDRQPHRWPGANIFLRTTGVLIHRINR